MKCPVNDKRCKYNRFNRCMMPNAEKTCDKLAEPYTGELEITVDGHSDDTKQS